MMLARIPETKVVFENLEMLTPLLVFGIRSSIVQEELLSSISENFISDSRLIALKIGDQLLYIESWNAEPFLRCE